MNVVGATQEHYTGSEQRVYLLLHQMMISRQIFATSRVVEAPSAGVCLQTAKRFIKGNILSCIQVSSVTISPGCVLPGISLLGRDLLHAVLGTSTMKPKSLLIVGPMRSGKTTFLRDVACQLSKHESGPKVVILDTMNDIGGDNLTPHASIGSARRCQATPRWNQASQASHSFVCASTRNSVQTRMLRAFHSEADTSYLT